METVAHSLGGSGILEHAKQNYSITLVNNCSIPTLYYTNEDNNSSDRIDLNYDSNRHFTLSDFYLYTYELAWQIFGVWIAISILGNCFGVKCFTMLAAMLLQQCQVPGTETWGSKPES